MLKKYIYSKNAGTMIEYALIITGISTVITVLVLTMGEDLSAIFQQVSDGLVNSASY